MSRETQETVGTWIDETFPGTDPESPRKSLRALEEMVELCFASGARPSEILQTVNRAVYETTGGSFADASNPQPDKIPVETADVKIVLLGIARMRGFNLDDEVDKKMAVNRARRWRPRGDGTGYHVKDGTV